MEWDRVRPVLASSDNEQLRRAIQLSRQARFLPIHPIPTILLHFANNESEFQPQSRTNIPLMG